MATQVKNKTPVWPLLTSSFLSSNPNASFIKLQSSQNHFSHDFRAVYSVLPGLKCYPHLRIEIREDSRNPSRLSYFLIPGPFLSHFLPSSHLSGVSIPVKIRKGKGARVRGKRNERGVRRKETVGEREK